MAELVLLPPDASCDGTIGGRCLVGKRAASNVAPVYSCPIRIDQVTVTSPVIPYASWPGRWQM